MNPLGTFRNFQIELFQFVEVIGLSNEQQSHLASTGPHDDAGNNGHEANSNTDKFYQCVPTIQAT